MPKKILVVDDEKDIVSVLLTRLKAHGYDAASAGSVSEALKIIQKEKFDLFILDIMMPVLDGTHLAQILRNDPKTRNIPRVFLTALGIKQEDTGYVLAGADIVFSKPYEFKKLAKKIDELIN